MALLHALHGTDVTMTILSTPSMDIKNEKN